MLESLVIKGKSPLTGYDRTHDFGAAWTDVDHNGCDTRNDILARDLDHLVLAKRSFRVMRGVLISRYTRETVQRVLATCPAEPAVASAIHVHS